MYQDVSPQYAALAHEVEQRQGDPGRVWLRHPCCRASLLTGS